MSLPTPTEVQATNLRVGDLTAFGRVVEVVCHLPEETVVNVVTGTAANAEVEQHVIYSDTLLTVFRD